MVDADEVPGTQVAHELGVSHSGHAGESRAQVPARRQEDPADLHPAGGGLRAAGKQSLRRGSHTVQRWSVGEY
eukprot:scaffold213_cov245-Pinguiococcus_pyrenoidosus.AAC.45